MHSLYCKHLGRWPLSGTKAPGQLFDIPQLSLPRWCSLSLLGEVEEATRSLMSCPDPASPTLPIPSALKAEAGAAVAWGWRGQHDTPLHSYP